MIGVKWDKRIEPQRSQRTQRRESGVPNFNPKTELDTHTNQLSSKIIGAAIEVHRILGPGYLEQVYEEALAIELSKRHISHKRQPEISITYKGQNIGVNRLDILVDNLIIVELKAVDSILPIHRAQIISYLKATGFKLGLLINFNVSLLKQGIHRIVLS